MLYFHDFFRFGKELFPSGSKVKNPTRVALIQEFSFSVSRSFGRIANKSLVNQHNARFCAEAQGGNDQWGVLMIHPFY